MLLAYGLPQHTTTRSSFNSWYVALNFKQFLVKTSTLIHVLHNFIAQ